jgi:hypothetical protein
MATNPIGITVDFSKCKWATPDEEAIELIPKEGILKDVLRELIESTDAPAIYHLAGVFTTAVAALSQCDLCVGDLARPQKVSMAMWSAVIGESGDRKSSALERSVYSFKQSMLDRMAPTDASVEAWHDSLSIQPNSLYYRDELSGLFDAARRTYSPTFRSWLLETWTGNELVRKTITHKESIITRPRLSILGGIPPSVFAEKTTKGDWRSGFLARFIYWGGKRQRWNPFPRGCESGKYTRWINSVAKQSSGIIWIPEKNAQPLVDWIHVNVELARGQHRPEIESTFQRLQETGYKLAAILEMSKYDRPVAIGEKKQILDVKIDSIVAMLPMLAMLKRTVEYVFADSSIEKETMEENRIIKLFGENESFTRREICEQTGLSARKVNSLVESLVTNDQLCVEKGSVTSLAGGRPSLRFKKKIV